MAGGRFLLPQRGGRALTPPANATRPAAPDEQLPHSDRGVSAEARSAV